MHVGVLDKATEQWPVPLELHDTFNKIKHTHCTVPLWVFLHEKLIDVDNVLDILTGVLIEIHFELCPTLLREKTLHSTLSMPTLNKSWSFNLVNLILPLLISEAQKKMALFE
jgi:hypothetical protein